MRHSTAGATQWGKKERGKTGKEEKRKGKKERERKKNTKKKGYRLHALRICSHGSRHESEE